SFDVIIGASFSGLTLAHHLPKTYKVLVVDAKPAVGSSVESTGLITSHTREEFASFFDIDTYITNPISSICVVAPDYDEYFISKTDDYWIYQTDTKGLVKALADTLPNHVTVWTGMAYDSVVTHNGLSTITLKGGGNVKSVTSKFLVGADGGHSSVAESISALDTTDSFLFGYEEVWVGDVLLGPQPAETIYHFWFGEFSLGYGGWLSPTTIDGKAGFRIGLAKLKKDRGDAKKMLAQFMQTLIEKKIVSIPADVPKPAYRFGSFIPIGGVLEKTSFENTLLIGDAAGYCGAFAADGIKGSVISGKESALLIERYLNGERFDLAKTLREKVNEHRWLIDYYTRQQRYRWIWDRMKRDRTFRAMYNIINEERAHFLDQFCDNKDKRKSLSRSVLKIMGLA
ncbi:MAG: hypothetical protein COY70_03785, partial [Candidatus Magasanikbacteria bacterium CG_4_10_14_0_8_um_filter_42_12]